MLGINGIVTPFLEIRAFTKRQEFFNAKIQTARALIERVNGVIKSRNQIIHKTVPCTKESNAELVIRAVVALHNDSINRRDLKMYANSETPNSTVYSSSFVLVLLLICTLRKRLKTYKQCSSSYLLSLQFQLHSCFVCVNLK